MIILLGFWRQKSIKIKQDHLKGYMREKLRKIMRTLLCLCLTVLFIPQVSWGRWLWVPGDHQGQGNCQQALQHIQRRLSTVLNERLQVNLKIDGQILSCRSVDCVRLRMVASDALVGVLTQSQCLKNALEIEVIVVPKKGKERIYRSRVSKQKRRHFKKKDAILAGVKLAEKIIKGPSPYPLKKVSSPLNWVIAVGWSSHTHHQASGTGSFFEIQSRYRPAYSLYEGGVSISQNQHQSQVWSDLFLSIGIQGRRYISNKGLSPFFGLGVEVSYLNYEHYRYQEDDDHPFLRVQYSSYEAHQTWGISPLLESGLFWWGKTLNPFLSVVFKPIWLTGSDLSIQRLHILGGVQW